jgi:hypothetical protein
MKVNDTKQLNKKESILIFIILLASFVLRLTIGIFSGGAESDAGDYTTWAFQLVAENDWACCYNIHSGRPIFHLWVFILVVSMKIFGATNFVAITTCVFFGTLSIYLFYRLVSVFFNNRDSIFITIIYAVLPTHINISHNTFYDVILLSVLLFSLENYFKYFKTGKNKHLIIAALIGTLIAFIHATGYIYIFIMWILFPIIDNKKRINWKKWLAFSILIGFLPIIQTILWKYYLNSFFPYQKLQSNLRYYLQYRTKLYEIRHLVRYFLYLVVSFSPLIFLSLWVYLFDIKWRKNIKTIIPLLFILLVIVSGFWMGIDKDYISPVVFIYVIIYVILLKKYLLNINKLLFFFGLLSIIIFTLYLRIMPRTSFGPRQFVYPATFLIPIMWYYGVKIFKNKIFSFAVIISSFIIMFIVAFLFNLPKYKHISPPGFNVAYASLLEPALLYYPRTETEKSVLKWCKQNDISTNHKIFTNISGRYINSNLNIPQNNYYVVTGVIQSHLEGISPVSLDYYLMLIEKKKPDIIIWDENKHNLEYYTFSKSGDRKLDFSYEKFLFKISENYKEIAQLKDRIYVFKRINK